MPLFLYKAILSPTEETQGELEAADIHTAASTLLARGLHVLDIQSVDEAKTHGQQIRLGGWGGLKHRDLVRTMRDLASLLKAGLPLSRCLEKAHTRSINTRWKVVADGMHARIADGQPLSQAFSTYPEVFSPLHINLVRAGEESGRLAEVLDRLAELGEKQAELRSRVKMALVYPGMMLTLGILTVFILVTFVVPTFVEVFRDTGQQLPLPTRVLVALSGFLSTWWWVIIPSVGISLYAAVRFLRSPKGARLAAQFVLHIPILGPLATMGEVAAFSRTLGTLLENGIHIVKAMDITSHTLSNPVFSDEALQFAPKIREGEPLSKILQASKLFPDIVPSVVSVGEESGTVSESLIQVAGEFERDVDRQVKVVMTLLEPGMILFIGVIVGFIVMAMLLPIFELGESIQL